MATSASLFMKLKLLSNNLLLDIYSTLGYNNCMTIIHTTLQKSKKRKPNAKQRELDASWEKIMTKYGPPKKSINRASSLSESGYSLSVPADRSSKQYPSRDTGVGSTALRAPNVYTGTAMLGVATMHKSNSVPVFSSQEAVEISSMRR
jgi:hypothetical protein